MPKIILEGFIVQKSSFQMSTKKILEEKRSWEFGNPFLFFFRKQYNSDVYY